MAFVYHNLLSDVNEGPCQTCLIKAIYNVHGWACTIYSYKDTCQLISRIYCVCVCIQYILYTYTIYTIVCVYIYIYTQYIYIHTIGYTHTHTHTPQGIIG